VLIKRNFFTVAAEAVNLPDDNNLKLMLSSVGKHFLKSLSVIVSTCHGTVDIFVYDGISLRCRVLMPFGELSFYGLLCLSVGRVAGINDGVCRGIRLLCV